jgi:hypothetical protein
MVHGVVLQCRAQGVVLLSVRAQMVEGVVLQCRAQGCSAVRALNGANHGSAVPWLPSIVQGEVLQYRGCPQW